MSVASRPGGGFDTDDLATVACRAGIALDNLQRGRKTDLAAISGLGRALRVFLTGADEPSSPSSLLDPAAAVIVNDAMSDVGSHPTAVADVVKAALDFAKELTSITDHSPINPGELGGLRQFALALSRRAIAADPVLPEMTSRHPYRE